MIITGEQQLQLPIEGPLYLPFYNIWLRNVYETSNAFDLDPFAIRAQSTSGSPVVLGRNLFAGFLNEVGGRFAYDGNGVLTVHLEPGQQLYVAEGTDPWEAWTQYNDIVLGGRTAEVNRYFWKHVEYCTWVEQKKYGFARGLGYTGGLDDAFIEQYIRRVDSLKLPRGKLTIDDGWAIDRDASGNKVFGDWQVDERKFPSLGKTAERIRQEGFTPGLWFAAGFITANSALAQWHPEWLGIPFQGPSENPAPTDRLFLTPCEEVKQHYVQLFAPYVQMGFRKFKLDMYYEDKRVMKQLLQLSYEALKQLDETIEVEIHVPDIFVSRYGDTIRTNDVLLKPEYDWRGATAEHYRVCRYSAPDKVINLDHVGSNNQDVTEEGFMEHWSMLRQYDGYPVVSLLPDHFSPQTAERFAGELREMMASLRSSTQTEK